MPVELLSADGTVMREFGREYIVRQMSLQTATQLKIEKIAVGDGGNFCVVLADGCWWEGTCDYKAHKHLRFSTYAEAQAFIDENFDRWLAERSARYTLALL